MEGKNGISEMVVSVPVLNSLRLFVTNAAASPK